MKTLYKYGERSPEQRRKFKKMDGWYCDNQYCNKSYHYTPYCYNTPVRIFGRLLSRVFYSALTKVGL